MPGDADFLFYDIEVIKVMKESTKKLLDYEISHRSDDKYMYHVLHLMN